MLIWCRHFRLGKAVNYFIYQAAKTWFLDTHNAHPFLYTQLWHIGVCWLVEWANTAGGIYRYDSFMTFKTITLYVYFFSFIPVSASMSFNATNVYKGYERAFCVRMKSTLTKRGCHFKSSGYRVRIRSNFTFQSFEFEWESYNICQSNT